MFNVIKLLQFAPPLSAAQRTQLARLLQASLNGLLEAEDVLLQPTLPGVYNGGDYLWHLRFPDEAAYRQTLADGRWRRGVDDVLADRDRIAAVDSVAYPAGRRGGKSPGQGVYRVLLLSTERVGRPASSPSAGTLARFEDELCAMPDYIASIRRWQLSRVTDAAGARGWTHVWEQEYADLQGLQGPYMMHPYHWGFIDRWFDPENPDWIVDPHLCHTFCALDRALIAPR